MDSNKISDWQSLVHKPVVSGDGRNIGEIESIQTERIVVINGPLTTDKYLIPKASIKSFDNGVVYLSESLEYVSDIYKFE